MAVINELPTRGGVKMELLWANSLPSQTFTGKNVSLDLNNYDTLLLVCIDATGTQNRVKNHILKKGYQNAISHFGFGASYQHYYRLTTVSNAGITFDNCVLAGSGTQNDHIIPLFIYGIK